MKKVATLLGWIITAIVIITLRWPDRFTAGGLYLMAANLLCGVVILAEMHYRGVDSERFRILFFASAQIAIIGLINISALAWPASPIHILCDYALFLSFFFCAYPLVGIADKPHQRGGYIPFNFFGFPRPRRVIFTLFGAGSTMMPLCIVSIEAVTLNGNWHPAAIQPPEACLLGMAILSLLALMTIWTRYRRLVDRNRKFERIILVGALCLILAGAGTDALMQYSLYVFGLSAVALSAIALQVVFLWRCRPEPEAPTATTVDLATA